MKELPEQVEIKVTLRPIKSNKGTGFGTAITSEGLVPSSEVREIINTQNPDVLTSEQAMRFSLQATGILLRYTIETELKRLHSYLSQDLPKGSVKVDISNNKEDAYNLGLLDRPEEEDVPSFEQIINPLTKNKKEEEDNGTGD